MPNELDFMKSRDEKGIPDDEFEKIRGEYSAKADAVGITVKKTIFMLICVLIVSFAAINITVLLVEGLPAFSFAWLIAFPIIISLFLYDPKVESDKKYQYEKDQKIILQRLKDNLKLNQIRLGAVIAAGIVFVVINIFCWWFVFDVMMEMGSL